MFRMARKKQVQTRIPVDTKEQLEEYQEERELSQADAVRRLINIGLAEEGHPVAKADGGSGETWLEKRRRQLARVGELSAAATVISTVYAILGLSVFNQAAFAFSVMVVAIAALATSFLCLILMGVAHLAIQSTDQDAEDSILGRVA